MKSNSIFLFISTQNSKSKYSESHSLKDNSKCTVEVS